MVFPSKFNKMQGSANKFNKMRRGQGTIIRWKCPKFEIRTLTFKPGNPLISSTESIEPKSKQPGWCHLDMSKPRESLLTAPTLTTSLTIAPEHFLQEDRPDFAYSTTVFGGGAIAGFRAKCFEGEDIEWKN